MHIGGPCVLCPFYPRVGDADVDESKWRRRPPLLPEFELEAPSPFEMDPNLESHNTECSWRNTSVETEAEGRLDR